MTSSERFFETVIIPPTPGDSHYVEGCESDLYFPTFESVDTEQIVSLGATHILLDVDGTVIPTNARKFEPSEQVRQKLTELKSDNRFDSVSLATENGRCAIDLLEILGMTGLNTTVISHVFQPFEAGKLGLAGKITKPFWRKILYELDCLETPEKVAMIGDSLARDILPAKSHGIRTVLVNRLERRLKSSELLAEELGK